jgi:hypothetical protein
VSKYKSILILDVSREILKKNASTIFDILPVWRWLWCQLVRFNITVDFFEELEDNFLFTSKRYDLLLVNIDNYAPKLLHNFLLKMREYNRNIDVYFCGYLPTVFPDKLMEEFHNINKILKGPLEVSLTEFCRELYGNMNFAYPIESELSEELKMKYCKKFMPSSTGMIQSSSGCPCMCAFCRYSEFYHDSFPGIYKQYLICEVMDEIEKLNKEFNINYMRLTDSNFLGSGRLTIQRAKEFAGALKERNIHIKFSIHCRSDCITESVISLLAEVGLKYVSIGIESMSPSQLERYEKKEIPDNHFKAVKILKKNGISIQGYAILADPLVTRVELIENLRGLYELSKDIQIVIHEKMTLYTTTVYFKKYKSLVANMQPIEDTFGAVVEYDFSDEWCNQYYKYIEDMSIWSYNFILKKFNEIKKYFDRNQREIYIRKATGCRIKLLLEIANKDFPDKKFIEKNKSLFIKKINNLR